MKRRILLTGGGTGIGRALAIELAGRGHDVLACGRRAEPLAGLKREARVHTLACDVSSEQDRMRIVDEAQQLFGGLDILINNAGVQETQVYGQGTLDHAKLEAEIRINLVAPMALTDIALPLLLKGNNPAIFNLMSLLAVTPKPTAPGYCASKSGLLGFTRSLRMQLADTPVRVVEVFPPLVDTPMTQGRGVSKISAEHFARAIADCIDSARERIAVGDASKVLRFARWMPALAERALRQMTRPTGTSTIRH
jgi:short-subunit dehydrogenase involved in D-alanine esterification of teichoic acids